MYFLAQFPVLAREQELHLRVYVLHVVLEDKAPFTYAAGNLVQAFIQDLEFVFAEQTYAA